MCPAVYEVRCSASVQVAAGLTEFVCLRKEAANNIEWSFDGLTKEIVPHTTSDQLPLSFLLHPSMR